MERPDAKPKKPAARKRGAAAADSASMPLQQLADEHIKLLRDEIERQGPNRAQRRENEVIYNSGSPKDDITPVNDWLANVDTNKMRPDCDAIIGEVVKNRVLPNIQYIGDSAAGNHYQAAQMRNLQSRSVIMLSDFFRQRVSAVKDAVITGDGWVYWGVRGAIDNPKVWCKHLRWDSVICDSVNVSSSGEIDSCRFVAKFALIEKDRALAMFPKFNAEIGELETGAPEETNSPLDPDLWVRYTARERYGNYAPSYLIGGTYGERRFVVYGVMCYRDVEGQIKQYPFVSDRNVSKIVPLEEPQWHYSHNMYPYLRWTDAIDANGLPYSKIAQGKKGLAQVQNYITRGMLKMLGGYRIVFTPDAIEDDANGGHIRSPLQHAKHLAAIAQHPVPIFFSKKEGALQFMDNASKLGEYSIAADWVMKNHNASGSNIHPSLTGGTGGKTPTAGVALRQHLDMMLTSHVELILSDQYAAERMGKMNIYNLRDFDRLGPNRVYAGENGEFEPLPASLLPDASGGGDVSARAIATGDLGVSVEPRAAEANMTQEKLVLQAEFVKTLGGEMKDEVAMMWIDKAKALGHDNEMVKNIAASMVKKGVPIPDKYLTLEAQELKRQVQKQRQEQAAEAERLERAAALGQIAKLDSEAAKNKADANKKNAEAAVSLSDDGLPPGEALGAAGKGGGAGGGAPDQASALAENAGLRQQVEQNSKQLRALVAALQQAGIVPQEGEAQAAQAGAQAAAAGQPAEGGM